ncbi:uncharacterized protein LOC123551798 [Mercenaria mercenaria]|uniref:uncharacterized protein LOC123551798 n=1 Tax=Mercenaria mercenaria TaxID=6596 RepID=UPI00234EE8F5|nr:uncharacterized protein LOC123551798 [Mercenaria mercenaria]
MLFRIIFVSLTTFLVKGDDNHLALENTACDLKARNASCVAGFCCVRDEFLYTETLCRPLGKAGDACSTKLTEFECPCEPGFRCASNIHGHVTSLFGKCYPIPGQTTDGSPTFVTSDIPDNDMTTADNNWNHIDTTVADSTKETTEGTTIYDKQTKPVQHDGDAIIG